MKALHCHKEQRVGIISGIGSAVCGGVVGCGIESNGVTLLSILSLDCNNPEGYLYLSSSV